MPKGDAGGKSPKRALLAFSRPRSGSKPAGANRRSKAVARLRHLGAAALGAWAAILGVAVLAAGLWFFLTPSRLRVAVVEGPEAKVIRAFAEDLRSERTVRLTLVEFANFSDAALAVETGLADFGIVQPDLKFPANAGTVAILREEALVLLAAENFAKISDLASARIALLTQRPSDSAMMRRILEHYDLPETKAQLIEVNRSNPPATGVPRMDAVAFMSTIGGLDTAQLVGEAVRMLGRKPKVLELPGTRALAAKSPGVSETTLSAGELQGRPPLPEEDIKTFGISIRLVAATRLDRTVVANLTEQLFQRRQLLARREPDSNLIKAPDSEQGMSAILPNHRGALDYFNREQTTFMDRYGDFLWLGLFAAGGLSSLFGWMAQTLARRRREAVDDILGRLLTILKDARTCSSEKDLGKFKLEIDDLVVRAVRHTHKRTTSTRTMSALMLAIDAARGAVDDRIKELEAR